MNAPQMSFNITVQGMPQNKANRATVLHSLITYQVTFHKSQKNFLICQFPN